MSRIPAKVSKRIAEGIRQYQPVLKQASSRDVNEADTSTIITDILADLFGYDKYSEITSEFMIRSTYCDLATLINGKINLLIEVKAIGIELKENHTRQAIDYASGEGIDWVVLTNGLEWKIYKVVFSKPIDQELVFEFNFLDLNWKKKKDIEMLFPLSKEGAVKSSLEEYRDQRQALSRFSISALILSDSTINMFRRELRKLSPGIKIEAEEIKEVIVNEVIKREVMESDNLKDASRKISKVTSKPTRKKKKKLEQKIASNQEIINIQNSEDAINPEI